MKKSQLAGFLLTVLFGPLGLFYSSVGSALVFIILALIVVPLVVPLIGGFAAVLFWLLSVLWGFFAVSGYNSQVVQHDKKLLEQAGINNADTAEIQQKPQIPGIGVFVGVGLVVVFVIYSMIKNNLGG